MVLTTSASLLITATVLYLKFVLVTTIQGYGSFTTGTRPPEDKHLKLKHARRYPQSFGLSSNGEMKTDKVLAKDIRWRSLVLNDVESIPLGLIAFLISQKTAKSDVVFHVNLFCYYF